MTRKPTIFAMKALALLVAIAVTPASFARSDDGDIARFSPQPSAAEPSLSMRPVVEPIIVAQGRCYNGHCY